MSICQTLVEKALKMALSEAAGCGELEAEFTIACDIVGGGPEDLVADGICLAAAAAVSAVCSEMSFDAMKKDVTLAAQKICDKV